MFTTEQVRREAIDKVQRWYASGGMRPVRYGADDAWGVLWDIAKMHPDWRVSRYCVGAGVWEERTFKAEWETWRQS
jgi:hypothetical protein